MTTFQSIWQSGNLLVFKAWILWWHTQILSPHFISFFWSFINMVNSRAPSETPTSAAACITKCFFLLPTSQPPVMATYLACLPYFNLILKWFLGNTIRIFYVKNSIKFSVSISYDRNRKLEWEPEMEYYFMFNLLKSLFSPLIVDVKVLHWQDPQVT